MSRRKTKTPSKAESKKDELPTMITEETKLLRANLRAMKIEIENEKKQLNEFQQQKEKIEKFWLMEKETRDDLVMQLRNKLRQKQDLEEKQAFELKIYKQKLKHLLHEMQSHMTDVRIDGQVALKLMQDDTRQTTHELKTNLRKIKVIKKQTELAHEDLKRNIRQETEIEIMQCRQDYERKAEELKQSYEVKMKTVRDRCDKERRNHTERIETRKKSHIKRLMKEHKSKFDDIKEYYRTITHANLDNIKQLKEDVGDMKKKEKDLLKLVRDITREHKRLDRPLEENKKKVEQLEKDAITFAQEKEHLALTQDKLATCEQQNKNLSWEHEILEQKHKQMSLEKEALEKKLEASIYSIQQKNGFKNLVLEKKLEAMKVDLQKTEAALAEVIASTNIGGGGEIQNSLEDVLMKKNQDVQRFERTLAELKQKYNEALVKYETKLAEYNIPSSELGFTPVRRF